MTDDGHEDKKLTALELETSRLRISIDRHNRLIWIATALSLASLLGKIVIEFWNNRR